MTISGQAGTDLTLTGLSGTSALTFTTGDWDTVQTVTVKAGQDADGADDSVTLTHTATGGNYAGETAVLAVTVDDDEKVSVVLSKTALSVDEGDTTGSDYTVRLSHQPSEQVTVTVSGQSGTDLTLTGLSGTSTPHLHDGQLGHRADGDGEGGPGRRRCRRLRDADAHGCGRRVRGRDGGPGGDGGGRRQRVTGAEHDDDRGDGGVTRPARPTR